MPEVIARVLRRSLCGAVRVGAGVVRRRGGGGGGSWGTGGEAGSTCTSMVVGGVDPDFSEAGGSSAGAGEAIVEMMRAREYMRMR